VSAEEIAAEAGTPVYVYSRAAVTAGFTRFEQAFAGRPHTVCYSVKANSNLAILALLARMGAGFDIVSGGELARVRAAGGDPARVVFSGVGKTGEEIEAALAAGILLFNAESDDEILEIARRARRLGLRAPLALRVNPDVGARTHPYVSTGLRRHKFGVEIARAEHLYLRAARHPSLDIAGVSCHIGSQIVDLAPFEEAFARVLELAAHLRGRGLDIRYLDFGGGLGVAYRAGERAPSVAEYARRIFRLLDGSRLGRERPASASGSVHGELRGAPGGLPAGAIRNPQTAIRHSSYHLLLEPGRAIVAQAGVLLTRVLYRKKAASKEFVIVDAAMNDLMRPALYGSYHEIHPVVDEGKKKRLVDVVGPICESGDFLAQDRMLPAVRPGDLLAIYTAGGYAASLGSNYNSRSRPPEALVEGKSWRLIREREDVEDLSRLERT
jgi:diaminopimelate decarboxylase